MDEYLQTDSLVAKAKAKYAKIISKTVMNSGGFDSANAGQNAFFYDSAEAITAVILVIAEFCSPYALALEQAKRKQKALEQLEKKEIAQMRKACIDKDIDFLPKAQTAILQKMLKQRFCFSQRNKEEKGEAAHIIRCSNDSRFIGTIGSERQSRSSVDGTSSRRT